MANGPLVKYAKWRLGLKIVGRSRYAHVCPGCKELVKPGEWGRHRCQK